MRKLFKIRSATKLALFSTATILVAMLIQYVFLSFSFEEWFGEFKQNGDAVETNAQAAESLPIMQFLLIMLIFVAPLAYVVSSLIIDRVLNPVRVMIDKVKSVGNKDFNSKIFIESSEDELAEYAFAFNQMSSKISEYIEKQKQFISDASHELTTPITVIVGHTDMLIRWGKDDPKVLSDGLATIKTEALAMNDLIENLLFFTRTDNHRIEYVKKNVDLSSLLKDCVEEQRRLHPDFTIIFNEPKQFFIDADSEAIKRVFRILFSNSVKYSKDVKQIEVAVESVGRIIRLRISDCGIGIAHEYLQRIFDRFFRVDDSRTKETGGTGLGLAIAKEILDVHSYHIFVQSEQGKGTTMIIDFLSSNLHASTITSS